MDLQTPDPDALPGVTSTLARWQGDGEPWQLHPGDLGWFQRFGAEATAAAVRTWSCDGSTVTVGLLDGDDLLRMTIRPDLRGDLELARRIADDIADPDRGVLPGGEVSVEAPADAALQSVLADLGWAKGEPWQPLRRDLTEPVEDPRLQVDVVDASSAPRWVEVQTGAFEHSTTTLERWHSVAAGPAFAEGRCLLAVDEAGEAVAGSIVWSAGPGRPGIVEPMGVHRDHRGRGYGRAICLAAAAALRDMGASSAGVYTESANVGAVATYRAAGFAPLAEIHDRVRR